MSNVPAKTKKPKKKRLSGKQRALIKARYDDKLDWGQCAEKAGYSCAQAAQAALNNIWDNYFDAMTAMGVSDVDLAAVLGQALDVQGKNDVPWSIKMKAVEVGARVKKWIGPESGPTGAGVTFNVGFVQAMQTGAEDVTDV